METIETIFLVLTYVAGIGFLIVGLDDLFFDAQFLRVLWRQRKQPRVTLPELQRAPEQWIAIFVPAWQEGGVVSTMAEYATRVLQYEKYDIFVGVYPNDPETNRCVDEVCARNPRLHKVLVPHAGPTCKADCLNWIYRAMKTHEIPGRREYQIIAWHEAEDVLHPLVLKVYNHHVPRVYDMAQIPVFALEFPIWKFWTANTYVDDFAELHTKDLFIRQSLGGFVPSAGVGTAFTRGLLDHLAAAGGGDPFRVGNLTEDYEIGLRVKSAGFRSGMVSVPVERVVRDKRANGTPGAHRPVTEIVAVRTVFPLTFRAAVHQRSRWILGISFQTWEQAGWPGNLAMRYTLFRDRRAPLTHVLSMIGYVVLAWLGGVWIVRTTPWAADLYLRPALNPDSWLWKLMIIDTGLLACRGVQKFISVYTLYGFAQAAMSLLRLPVNNVINFAATARATKLYFANKLFRTPIVWLKTDQVMPGPVGVAEHTRTIEDLVRHRGLATTKEFRVHEELYWELGPVFWWCHRLLPLDWETIATAAPVHPLAAEWLGQKTGARVDFVGERPGRLPLGVEFDPDRWLIDHLVKKRLLKERDLPQLEAVRASMTDPLPRWLALQQLVTEGELHEVFLECSHLPLCRGWNADEVKRLVPVLPPGFAPEHGCYCLEERQGQLRIGLAQLPSASALRELHDRLGSYPVAFEAVRHVDAIALHQLVSQ